MLKVRTLGELRSASLYRLSAMPTWSDGGWLMQTDKSGGVLDMHIHDIDVALWWLGEPESVAASVERHEGLPVSMDALWSYPGGCEVRLTGKWVSDPATEFRHGFELTFEKGKVLYDLKESPGILRVVRPEETTDIPMSEPAPHQAELDEFALCVAEGRRFDRFTPADSELAVKYGLEELEADRD
jgi:predicted dehydrogenase